jgi:hypothetical protein
MSWNLGLIEQFYRNRMSEPGEYARLIASLESIASEAFA